MDGPNIFEKKKQRYEKIQRMRGNFGLLPGGINDNSVALTNPKRSRDDTTPNGGISSSVSNNNIPSS